MKKLTPREMQVLKYLVKGLSNNEIASSLYLSIDTVKMYLKQIYEKLEVNNRVSAVVKAILYELVKKDEI